MTDFSRRALALAAFAGAASVGVAQAAEAAGKGKGAKDAKGGDMASMGHDHMAMMNGPPIDVALSPAEASVVIALSQCGIAAQQCLSFSIEALAGGDASMKKCARSVRDVAILCEATKALINARSNLARTQMALCRQACIECKGECEEHAMHHATCRASAEACSAAINAMNVILG